MYETERELKEFDAGALRIEQGPRWRDPSLLERIPPPPIDLRAASALEGEYGQIKLERGGGKLPVLSRGDPPLIIRARDLPVGRRVRITGTMEVEGIYDPDGPGQTRVSRIKDDLPSIEANEHTIVVERIEVIGSAPQD